MFTGEATKELQQLNIKLQIAVSRQGLQDVCIDRRAKQRTPSFHIKFPGNLGNTVEHLIISQHGKLA